MKHDSTTMSPTGKKKSKKVRKAKDSKPAVQKSKVSTAMYFFDRRPKSQARNNMIEIGKGSSSRILSSEPPAKLVNTDA